MSRIGSKLWLSLLGNQFLASVGGFMCIIFVWFIAGDSIAAQLVFLCITFPFFMYIEYRAAFTCGFHNPDRRNKPDSRAYIYQGALSGLLSAIPLYLLIIIYIAFKTAGEAGRANLVRFFIKVISMYYNWPMCNIFPNHQTTVILTSMIWVIVFPMIGYIAGYKNFVLSDSVLEGIKKLRK